MLSRAGLVPTRADKGRARYVAASDKVRQEFRGENLYLGFDNGELWLAPQCPERTALPQRIGLCFPGTGPRREPYSSMFGLGGMHPKRFGH